MATRRAIAVIAAIAVMFFLISIEATKRKQPVLEAAEPEPHSVDEPGHLED